MRWWCGSQCHRALRATGPAKTRCQQPSMHRIALDQRGRSGTTPAALRLKPPEGTQPPRPTSVPKQTAGKPFARHQASSHGVVHIKKAQGRTRPRENEARQLLLAAYAMHVLAHSTGQQCPCRHMGRAATARRTSDGACPHYATLPGTGDDPLQCAQSQRRRCSGPHAHPGALRRRPRAPRRSEAGHVRHARRAGSPDAPGGARLCGSARSCGQRGGSLRRGPRARTAARRRVARAWAQAIQAGQAGGDRVQAGDRDGGPCQVQAAQRRQAAQRARARVAHARAVGQVQALQARAAARPAPARAARRARSWWGIGSAGASGAASA